MELDDINKKILNLLIEDSKISFRTISKKVRVSTVTAFKRIKQLKAQGIIKSYTLDIDYEKLGYDITVIINVRISKGKLSLVENKISTNPHVFAIYDVTGDFDSVILARFKNRKSMDVFLKKIQTYDFIERTKTNVVLNTIKEKSMFAG